MDDNNSVFDRVAKSVAEIRIDKELMDRNTEDVNKLFLKLNWIVLFVPVLMCICSITGVFTVTVKFTIIWFLCAVSCDIALTVLNKIGIPARLMKYFLLFSFELLIFIGATQASVGIYASYILVPMISCAYIDKKFAIKFSGFCYILMILALWLRSERMVEVYYTNGHYTRLSWFTGFASGFTMEYIAFFLGLRMVCDRIELFIATLSERNERISKMQYRTIQSFANLIESRDDSTGQHVKRTSSYVKLIVDSLKERQIYSDIITDELRQMICDAASLHDIGKIKIPDTILCKPGKLTKEEFEIIKSHTTEGCSIIEKILPDIESDSFIRTSKSIVLYHHERWDGTGYPIGLKGDEIPVGARIMAVADVFDALTSRRCYKNSMPVKEAFGIIEEESGTHFDPVIAEAFLSQREKIEKLIIQNTEV